MHSDTEDACTAHKMCLNALQRRLERAKRDGRPCICIDLVNEKKVRYSRDVCSECGGVLSLQESIDRRLCSSCQEMRQERISDLRRELKRQFGQKRDLMLRSCFLKMLLSKEIDLEASGWKMALALGCELKATGFDAKEAYRVLTAAGGRREKVTKLLDAVYGHEATAYPCEHIKSLGSDCTGCPNQFAVRAKESWTKTY